MQISQLVLKFENVSKALKTEVKHVVNGPKKPRKKVTEIRRYYNWNCSQYIKLNAAYKIRARQTNKLSKSAFRSTGKKYTIYVFLLVAKLKNISPSSDRMSHGIFHVQFQAKYQFTQHQEYISHKV